jgi:hypothetical protein
MNASETVNWHDANQRYLTAALSELRYLLEQRMEGGKRQSPSPEPSQEDGTERSKDFSAMMPAPPALETLCEMFGLSTFERQILLLCAGVELDSAFPGLFAAAHGDPRRTSPTFSLALAVFPDAHWSALSPARPLRRWRFIETAGGENLTQSPLRIDERVLHYLTGLQDLDERLVGYVEPVEVSDDLVPSQHAVAERLAVAWSGPKNGARLPVVHLCGEDIQSQRAIAVAACARLGFNLHAMCAHSVPLEARELAALIRLWEREAVLSASALLLDCRNMDASDATRRRAISHLIKGTHAALIVAGRERLSDVERPVLTFDVPRPTAGEQHDLWQSALGPAVVRLNGQLEILVRQFSLNPADIRAACAEGLARVNGGSDPSPETSGDALAGALWDACRKQTRPQLSNLAQLIEPAATLDDLVLPEDQRQILREIGVHVRQRMKVYDTWGFAAKSSRGLGISALFSGPSGTGKTMAAEVLANELQLDLYRIDLSQVVSKYIGETEKNLRRVFDAAEGGNAILLFDEADALFGKRSEIKDSHDRYANIEIGYLLQRMEAYQGLAILTTNMKNALDNAFLRRLRFMLQFPFPDAAHRAEIWRRVFPRQTPTDGLDMCRLACLNVAGGNIRNIALYAAFVAAEAERPVCMSHVLRAAQVEYAKLEKPLTQSEIGGWV